MVALFCKVLLSLFGGLPEQIFRATGTMLGNLRYAWLDLISQFFRCRDLLLLAHAAGTGVSIWLAQRGDHGILWGTKLASKDEIKAMIRPAVSFMAFPLANALSLQGITLLTGALTGTAAVALFNTYRTIARVAVQLTAMLSHAYRRSVLLGAAQSVGLSLCFILFCLGFCRFGHMAGSSLPAVSWCGC